MALRSFATLSVLASAALAQYSPSGVSSQCSSFIAALNNDTNLLPCLDPFLTAFSPFAPGSPAPSADTISTALGTFCASNASSACPQNVLTTQLAQFYAACTQELTSPDDSVISLYDLFYSIWPLSKVLCARNDDGSYCATNLSNSSSTGAVDQGSTQQTLLSNYLYTPPGSTVNSTTPLAPNMTTYQLTNLVFMFLSPSMSASTLCKTCTRNILTPYIDFESNCPYAPGLNNSLLFAGQPTLYNAVNSKCGQSFLSGAVQAAGGLSSGYLSGAAPLAVGQELSAAVGAILGVAAFVAASL